MDYLGMITSKSWSKAEDNDHLALLLAQRLGISEILARLLAQKGLSPEDASAFLDPKLKLFMPDPFHLLDMDLATERTKKAIAAAESIYIFGDYDVDGATSSSLLKRVFRDLGVEVGIYIPDRMQEGYGLSNKAVENLKKHGAQLIITVDCGATSHEAIDFAASLGMDVIVLDHHLGSDLLPNACAIVNPNRVDQRSNYSYLAAVGVAFLFSVALVNQLRNDNFFAAKDEPNLFSVLDLVALGTVCDVMPLEGFNRALVSQGIKIISTRQNLGIRTLLDFGNVNDHITTYHLGFVLGPRINAGGRVGRADHGARLLSSTDITECTILARELCNFNLDRQAIEAAILEESLFAAELQRDKPIICVYGDGWHHGVIGIIASRIKERFNKPTIVITFEEELGKASCRSVRGVNIGRLIIEAREQGLLVAGGGHGMAAGFTIMRQNFEAFCAFIQQSLIEHDFSDASQEYYNAELSLNAITLDLVKELDKLAPFGAGNSEPLFKIDNVSFRDLRVFADKHVSLLVVSSNKSNSSNAVRAICFNGAREELLTKWNDLSNVAIIANLRVNSWNGRESAQLIVHDIL